MPDFFGNSGKDISDAGRNRLLADAMRKRGPTMRNHELSLYDKARYKLGELLGDTRSSQRQADRITGLADLMTPFGDVVMGSDAIDEAQRGNYGKSAMFGGLAAIGAVPGLGDVAAKVVRNMGKASKKGIRAFHGSPHTFDKFSSDAIGTGEGAQAYGHGLYFAENEGVARSYRDALAKADGSTVKPDAVAVEKFGTRFHELSRQMNEIAPDGHIPYNVRKNNPDIQGKYDALFNQRELIADEMIQDTIKRNPHLTKGSMFEVNINADPEDFYDFDAPTRVTQPEVAASVADEMELMADNDYGLYQQRDEVQQAIEAYKADPTNEIARTEVDEFMRQAVPDYGLQDIENTRALTQGDLLRGDVGMNADKTAYVGRRPTGETAEFANEMEARSWVDEITAEDTARHLQEQGYPGIKYFDGGSRAAGEGSRNFVVFDPEIIDIVRRYGIAGALAGGLISQEMANQMQEQGLPDG